MNQQPASRGTLKWLLLVLVLVLLVAFGVYYFYLKNNGSVTSSASPSPSTSAKVSPSASPSTSPIPSGWKTFINKTYSYSFNYPGTYSLVNGLYDRQTKQTKGTDQWVFVDKKQITNNQFIADSELPQQYLEFIVTDQESTDLNNAEEGTTKTNITFAGEQAVKSVMTSPSVLDETYSGNIRFNHAGKSFTISWKNDDATGKHDAIIDQILATFVFTK